MIVSAATTTDDGSTADAAIDDRDFRAEDLARRRLSSKIGCWLAMLLMPFGTLLDLMVYPALVLPFLAVRLLCSAAVLGIYLLHDRPHSRTGMRTLNLAWVLVINAGLCGMIALTEGAASPYYAGLNLVFLAMILLMPLTWLDALIGCGISIGMYLAACLLAGDPLADIGPLFNNLYFLLLTSLVCCIASSYLSRMRYDEFVLRHRLDSSNRELDTSNRELATSNTQLSELIRLRAEFTANISHELRTPLTLILGPIDDLLTSGRTWDRATAERLGMVRENGLRLLKLINDLLELVRLEDGSQRLARRPLELGRFLTGLTDSVRYLAESKLIDLQLDGPEHAVMVEGDSARLEKVFLNLVTNAIKFTPGEGCITVAWRRDEAEAVVEVRDTGIGIPADELPHVFERFRQVDGTSTRAFQGSGLGLALVRELVAEHGGAVVAESEPGRGSTFRVTLPLAAEPDASAEIEPAIAPSLAGDRSAELHAIADRRGGVILPLDEVEDHAVGSGAQRVMVVDDEPDMRRYLVAALSDTRSVYQAADGPSALEGCRRHRPALVLLDLMLPGMDGLEVCRRLRADPEAGDCKIILLTARGDEASKIEALRHGADDFLTKPFSTTEVITRIDNLLRSHDLQRRERERAAEVQRALDELHATEARLIQSEKARALGDMAAGIMHEIGNPLNYTMTALEVANADAHDDPDLQECLDDMREGLTRIKHIIADMRTFAYPGDADDQRPVPVRELVDSALRLTGSSLREVAIDTAVDPGHTVLGSRSQLLHLLMNLIVNAAWATDARDGDDEPGRIGVSSQLDGDGRVRIAVRDNGIGIAPEIRDRIFDPFFTTREVQDGMGLGLSLCRTIAEHHDGSIAVDSEPGRGTTMTLTLHNAYAESHT